MVPRRASFTASAVVRIALGSTVALGTLGCGLMKHGEPTVDAGTDAAASAAVDAAPPTPPTPDNVNNVGRFPDEVTMNDAEAKIEDASVVARNAVPGGALVATLRLGTAVTQVAKHGSFVLGIFADPKNPSHTLEGWIAEQAFVPGPTVPGKGGCPTGETKLMADDQDFCGRLCKNNSDCVSGQVCEGKANLITNGKAGAETTTCTMAAGGAVMAGDGVVPAESGNACMSGYFYLATDKFCHRDCSKSACPGKTHCMKIGTESLCQN